MDFMNEIEQTARELGELLAAETSVSSYLKATRAAQQDAAATALELRYIQLFEKLAGQEQRGEPLQREEVDEFYALKRQVQEHPLLGARDDQQAAVQALFAETAQQMTAVLGFDYTAFAR